MGRIAAVPVAVAVYVTAPTGPDGLSDAGRATAAIAVLMAVLWLTEAMPLPATALVPVVLFPVTGALPLRETTAAYANEVIFLILGGFMIARAMERWDLHRRIALTIVSLTGTGANRLIGGFMIATAFLSMWISNTATVVLMLPIALSVIRLLEREGRALDRNLTIGLLLGIAYAASIGSIGTLIGTPPNLFMRAFLEDTYGVEIGFAQWMAFGLPLVAVFLPITWLLLTRVVYRTGAGELPGSRELIRRQLAAMGPPSRGERVVLAVFAATVAAWILREPVTGADWLVEVAPWVADISDTTIAVAAALALFAIPVDPRRGEFALDWHTAVGLPWGVLVLIGGGLSLARGIQENGVDAWIGGRLAQLDALPLLMLMLVVAVTVIFLTEFTSNTATAATLLPILGGVAVQIGLDPMVLVVPAALAASCAFMMPVATPPNAVVFASGHVTIGQMVRAGMVLNVIGAVLIVGAMYALAPLVLGVDL